MSHYSFPILENREILECMSELGCSLNDEQLTKPTAEHISRVMEQLLDIFMGFSADDHAQMKFSGMDVFDHPEIHEFSIGQLAFNRSIWKLMQASGVHDFSHRDLAKPEYPRLRKIFSAVINFAKFREEKVATFEQFVESTEGLHQEKAEVDAKFEELTSQLHHLRAQREKEAPVIAELQTENERMEQEIKNLNVEQGALRTKIHELKQTRQTSIHKRENDQFTLHTLRSEVSKLESQVVRSPERVRKEMGDMQSTLEQDKGSLAEMDERLQSLRQTVDGLNKTEKDVAKLMKHLKEVEENLGKLKAANKEVKRLQTETQEQEGALRELTVQEQSLKRQLHSASARGAELEARQRLKREAADREMDRWKQAAAEADKENMQLSGELERVDEETRHLEKRMLEMQAQEGQEVARFEAEREAVVEKVRGYNRRLLATIAADE